MVNTHIRCDSRYIYRFFARLYTIALVYGISSSWLTLEPISGSGTSYILTVKLESSISITPKWDKHLKYSLDQDTSFLKSITVLITQRRKYVWQNTTAIAV